MEVASAAAAVFVRDSKDVAGPVLEFGTDGWAGFIAGVRGGEFDRLRGAHREGGLRVRRPPFVTWEIAGRLD